MKRRIAIATSVLLFAQTALANVVGIDTQNFNPTSNGIDFVTVQSSQTLEPGIMNLGFFFNYAINTLPNYQNVTTQGRTQPKDQLASADMSLGLGLMKNWDIGLTIPAVIFQNVDESSTVFRGQFESNGITEYRANTKYRFFGDADGGLATVLSMNWYAVENYPFTGVDPGPTFNLELAYDFNIGLINIGTNVGYRKRNPGAPIPTVPVQPYGDQYIMSVAGSYLVSSIDTKFIAEIFGSIPKDQTQFASDRDLSSAEFLFGAKWDVRNDIAIHAGMGTELYQGSASPDWRVYTGINWAIGPLFGRQYETTREVVFIDDVDFTATAPTSETFIAKDVLFEFNSAKVNPDFQKTLKQLVDYLLKDQGFKSMVIVGHTDSVGSIAYNDNLSEKRAASVRRELYKVLPSQHHSKIRSAGRGEREPIADNGNFQGRSLNRRVEFTIRR